MFLEFVDGFNVNECVSDQPVCHRPAVFRTSVSQAWENAGLWDIRSYSCDPNPKGCAYACSRSFMLNSYLTRMVACSTVVRRDINSVLDAGVDSSGDIEGAAVIAVGELGAELEAACLLSEESALIIFVAFLRAVRKSSTIEIVRKCDRKSVLADPCGVNHPSATSPAVLLVASPSVLPRLSNLSRR